MKNAVIYARFSSHAQNEQSIEGQLKECYAFAERSDLRIVHEYIDEHLTGTNDKLTQFLQIANRKVRHENAEQNATIESESRLHTEL